MVYRTKWGVRCLLASVFAVFSQLVSADLSLNDSPTPSAFRAVLNGPAIQIENIKFVKGVKGQFGLFVGGTDATTSGSALGIPDGIYLSTGSKDTVLGPNNNDKYTYNTRIQYGDPDLTAIAANAIYDPVVIEFDLIPEGDQVNFLLVFGSEEYPEYVCSKFNDVFGLFVSGPGIVGTRNAAFIPGSGYPIAVNNVNSGMSGVAADGAACNLSNSIYFVDNGNGSGSTGTQLDGFTHPMIASLGGVQPGQRYRVKLALADAGDQAYDSAAFFKWLTSTSSDTVDLELSAVPSTERPATDGFLDIEYTIRNTSLGATRLVEVGIELPLGVVFISDDSGGSFDSLEGIWRLGEMGGGESKTLNLRISVGDAASYQVPAEIQYAFNEDPDSTPYNRLSIPDEDDTAVVTLAPIANNPPMISHANSAASANISYFENATNLIIDLDAQDLDGGTEGNGLSWTIAGGEDAERFTLDARGGLRFIVSPDYENPLDYDTNNSYEVIVRICDPQAECDAQTVNVEVIDVLEDVDGDGVPSDIEAVIGSNPGKSDTDGDGLDDGTEIGPDYDNLLDTDGDGTADVLDTDDDGDGIPTLAENYNGGTPANDDSDGDGIPDYRDSDDDGDGVDTEYENYNGSSPLDDDSDDDGVPDYLDSDDDADGALTRNENPDANGDGNPVDAIDRDNDGQPDYLDYDNSNPPDDDGVPARIEDAIGSDPTKTDTDGDGVDDGTEIGPDYDNPRDTDGDGTLDVLDTDDDGDGVLTAAENHNGGSPIDDDTDADGVPDYLDSDDDGDGLATRHENYNGGTVADDDSDNDGTPDYLDSDDDGDGLLTKDESPDPNGDGNPADAIDSEGDGQVDYLDVDNDNAPGADTDGDGITNERENELGTDPDDPDSDNDGVNDGDELDEDGNPRDSDHDGIPDFHDLDDDNDGILNVDENYNGGSLLDDDTDRDKKPDYLDDDDDNDNILTRLEDYNGNGALDDDTDSDGIPDYLDTDDDGDGVFTLLENYNAALPLDDDTDGDGIPDYLDTDDDGDGLLTINESADPNQNGNPDDAVDTDQDGLNNYLDADDDGDGLLTINESADPNGDGDPADAIDADLDAVVEYLDDTFTPFVRLKLRAMLQGAYSRSTGLMHNQLWTSRSLPMQQPYSSLELAFGYGSVGNSSPFSYQGDDTLSETVANAPDGDAVVDWLLIEVRNSDRPTDVLAATAAIVQADGDLVVPETGDDELIVSGVAPGEHYIAIRHRNHLGVMTATPVTMNADQALEYDFTSADLDVYGHVPRTSGGQHELMWSGDLNNSNSIVSEGPGSDMSVMLGAVLVAPANLEANANYPLAGYYASDLNMDGKTVYSGPLNDTNLLIGNVLLHPDNAGNYFSNFVIQGTLP